MELKRNLWMYPAEKGKSNGKTVRRTTNESHCEHMFFQTLKGIKVYINKLSK